MRIQLKVQNVLVLPRSKNNAETGAEYISNIKAPFQILLKNKSCFLVKFAILLGKIALNFYESIFSIITSKSHLIWEFQETSNKVCTKRVYSMRSVITFNEKRYQTFMKVQCIYCRGNSSLFPTLLDYRYESKCKCFEIFETTLQQISGSKGQFNI